MYEIGFNFEILSKFIVREHYYRNQHAIENRMKSGGRV